MRLLCAPLQKIYVLLIIIVAYFNLQDELSVKLLDFLESPHSTTDSLLAEKEQVQLILHLLLPLFHSATFCYDFGTLKPYVYCNVVIPFIMFHFDLRRVRSEKQREKLPKAQVPWIKLQESLQRLPLF